MSMASSRMRTRQWAPMFLLVTVFVFSWIGYDGRETSWAWALGGLAFGTAVVLMVHFGLRREL